MPKFQSLHSHTTISDGKLSHQELLDAALGCGIDTIAFTDHDSLANPQLLKSLARHPVRWVSGIELSAGSPSELASGPNGPHIVGLFVDPQNKSLNTYCMQAQQARIEVMEKTVKNLSQIGFQISPAECLQAAGIGAVGKPHIVQALGFHQENVKVMDDLVAKLATASKSDPKLKVQYDNMLLSGTRQYPYVLFLSESAFIKDVYVERTFWLDFDQSVALIRNAGGVAIFAHYSTEREHITLTKLDEILARNRIDGVETVYGLWELKTPKAIEIDQDRNAIRQLLTKHQKLPSGGADVHTLDDLTSFAALTQYAQETVGMIENIVSNSNVDTTWSSFT